MYDKMNDWLMKELRRIHYKWLPRKQCMVNARVSRGKYICKQCGQLFGPKEIQIDHIEPVINPQTGFVDWNTYIQRLFSPLNNYQVLCKKCHSAKSAKENAVRREVKNEISK